jgi:hypothetical protein
VDCPGTALEATPTLGRFLYYKILTAVPVFAALVAIARHADAWYWPFVYVVVCLVHAGIMYTIKCPYCAYYKLEGKKHRCFIWWGVPKLYEPRTGQEPKFVGIYAKIGMLVLAFFPVYWLWSDWVLLVVYFLSLVGLVVSIGMHQCPRCLHFDCAHNQVPEDVKELYRKSVA